MERLNALKAVALSAIGVIGGGLASLFGGWDKGLSTLLIVMLIDYITGLMLAGIFKNSPKSDNGALKSIVGWKGICKKVITLLMVLIAYNLDIVAGTDFIRDATIIAYIVNEIISIIENAGQMGVFIPGPIKKGIDILLRDEKKEEINKEKSR